MFNTPEELAARDATRAARARTGLSWISQQAAFGGGRTPVLVIYRLSGSSIVITMHDAMPVVDYCAFVMKLTREDVRQHILLEVQRLQRHADTLRPKAMERALNDAEFLRRIADSIPATN